MHLTKYEKEMLEGRHGEAKKFAMTILVKLGELYDADRMIEVVSAQIMAHYGSLHDAGLEYAERLVDMGGKFCIPATEDPASVSFTQWKEMGIEEEYYKKQKRLAEAIAKLGAEPVWTCTPYFVGNLPRFGQNVSWAESSAVSFANSVIGARTNRTPAGLNYCAAITGRMPLIGLYLKENRRGNLLIKVDAGELSELDYHTIGYIIGKIAGNDIPVLEGIPDSVTTNNLRCLGAAAASSGCVPMYHIPGITPEATAEDPFFGIAPDRVFEISRKSIEQAEKEINTASEEPDIIAIGCPHYTVEEMGYIAELLEGKKVRKDLELWIYTSETVFNLSQNMGYVKRIIDAGGRILYGTCLVISPMGKKKFHTLMTDSAKFAYYLPSEHNVKIRYADTEKCISKAVQ